MQGVRLAIALVLLLARPAAAENKVEKLTFSSGDTKGTYYLHGSGHNGKSLIDPWMSLAKAEGIVLVAPDASDPRAWRFPQEGPQFIYDLLETLRAAHKEIDDRRMYVFGHSAGAIHGLDLGLMESQYFAAVAVHAGVVSPEVSSILPGVPRKIPMAIWVGTNDAFFPLKQVRNTRDVLAALKFDVTLTEIPNHTHDYYGSAASINKEVWAFLQRHTLEAPPQFQAYQLRR
jgi:predicted esterase